MITADTSLTVAAFASWHEAHTQAVRALRQVDALPSQVLVETYSVLTRLPPPHRSPSDVVASYLAERFSARPLTLPPSEVLALIDLAQRQDIAGGAIYDAVVALSALRARATLLTSDRRAARTYDLVGARYDLI